MFCYGTTWNNAPLSVGEWTMGDYLRPLSLYTVLVGKTHMRANDEGMARLQVIPSCHTDIIVCGHTHVKGIHRYGAV